MNNDKRSLAEELMGLRLPGVPGGSRYPIDYTGRSLFADPVTTRHNPVQGSYFGDPSIVYGPTPTGIVIDPPRQPSSHEKLIGVVEQIVDTQKGQTDALVRLTRKAVQAEARAKGAEAQIIEMQAIVRDQSQLIVRMTQRFEQRFEQLEVAAAEWGLDRLDMYRLDDLETALGQMQYDRHNHFEPLPSPGVSLN